jgi:hypothetical protein
MQNSTTSDTKKSSCHTPSHAQDSSKSASSASHKSGCGCRQSSSAQDEDIVDFEEDDFIY